jgi:O-antigen/teichoic acid export membrane protein
MMHEMTTAFTWEVDSFILARFSNARMLGTYVVASELAETPTVELGTSVARAASPSLSKLNDNHDDLKSLYQKSLAMLVLIGAPAGVGINVLAQELSDLVLGDKWQAAIPFIEIIAIVSIFSLFTTISISALISSGRIKVLAFLSLTRLIVRSTILALGFYYFGVYGLVVATLVASIIYIMISLCTQRYYNLISFREIFGLCWRCITSTVIMYFSLLPIQDSLDKLGYGDLFDLVVITLAGIVIYSISLLIIWIVIGKKDGPEKEIVSFLKNR